MHKLRPRTFVCLLYQIFVLNQNFEDFCFEYKKSSAHVWYINPVARTFTYLLYQPWIHHGNSIHDVFWLEYADFGDDTGDDVGGDDLEGWIEDFDALWSVFPDFLSVTLLDGFVEAIDGFWVELPAVRAAVDGDACLVAKLSEGLGSDLVDGFSFG